MKYLSTIFFVLTFSGCAALDPIRNRMAGCEPTAAICAALGPVLNLKSEQDVLFEKVDSWATSQVALLSKDFEQGFPLHQQATRDTPSATEWISTAQLSDLKQKIIAAHGDTQGKLKDYDKPMKELRKNYDDSARSLLLINSSASFIDSKVSLSGATLADDLNFYPSQASPLCDKLNMPVRKCSNSLIGEKLVQQKFYSNHPEIADYRSWLSDASQSIESTKDMIEQHGLAKETKSYLSRAQNTGCNEVKRFNFWNDKIALSRATPYTGEAPEKESVYDLAGFKVLQSTNGGILLKPAYSDAYNAQPIFVQTKRKYADGFTFQGADQLVCFTGKTKDYLSVLGASRRVYAFQAISDDSKYYFLPWRK
ncbi:MAG: hypothetical protein KBT87_02140 [Gammaproteobacteria bacterium]|nr:hypothetical protein [Gammaproteobacteria bacterium]MBQ0773451.1 hypothetical protein [Gammaproteobacteria bacterium]